MLVAPRNNTETPPPGSPSVRMILAPATFPRIASSAVPVGITTMSFAEIWSTVNASFTAWVASATPVTTISLSRSTLGCSLKLTMVVPSAATGCLVTTTTW